MQINFRLNKQQNQEGGEQPAGEEQKAEEGNAGAGEEEQPKEENAEGGAQEQPAGQQKKRYLGRNNLII